MKKYFKTNLDAIQWISENAKNEAHFEVLREELTFNHIYTERYFVHEVLLDEDIEWMDSRPVATVPFQQIYPDIQTWDI